MCVFIVAKMLFQRMTRLTLALQTVLSRARTLAHNPPHLKRRKLVFYFFWQINVAHCAVSVVWE